jgi:hypothetical protein
MVRDVVFEVLGAARNARPDRGDARDGLIGRARRLTAAIFGRPLAVARGAETGR